MTDDERSLLQHSTGTLKQISDNKWSNISLNSVTGASNKKITQMLKACDINRKSTNELNDTTTHVLTQGYKRLLSCAPQECASSASHNAQHVSLPNLIKIQWLRSFNVKSGSTNDGCNAQDLHRDYEHAVGPELVAHSVLFTLDEASHLIIMPMSHTKSEEEIDNATEDEFQILEIPPYSMVFFHSQLAHAGPLFHVPQAGNKPHHFRGFASLVKQRADLPESGGRKRWLERVFLH